MATLPTPPAAPVTSTSPSPGFRPCSSSAMTASIAVKPAVPIAIARLLLSAAGSATSQSPLTRAFWRVAAPLRLADAPAGEDHVVARAPRRVGRRLHRAGEIHARDVRIAAHQPPLPVQDQPVLVVQGRVLDRDGDVARRQLLLRQLPDAAADLAVRFLENQRLEHHIPPTIMNRDARGQGDPPSPRGRGRGRGRAARAQPRDPSP